MRLLTILGMYALLGTGCTHGKVPTALQGKWVAGENHEDGTSWTIEYNIDRKGYTMEGYPPISARGNIRLLAQEEHRYHLALSNVVFHGEAQEKSTLWVELQKQGDVLKWGSHTLQRQKPTQKK